MSKLDPILKLEGARNIVIEIDDLLWDKSGKEEDFEGLNQFEKNVVFILMLQREVNNGGFGQYFFNSAGRYAHEALNGLKEIKAPKIAEMLNQAINAFPSLPVPKDRQVRELVVSDVSQKVLDTWSKLNQEFYQYPENLYELLAEYVKENREKFEE